MHTSVYALPMSQKMIRDEIDPVRSWPVGRIMNDLFDPSDVGKVYLF